MQTVQRCCSLVKLDLYEKTDWAERNLNDGHCCMVSTKSGQENFATFMLCTELRVSRVSPARISGWWHKNPSPMLRMKINLSTQKNVDYS